MTHQQANPPFGEVLRDVVSVLMIVVGALGVLALSVLRADLWLLGAEGLLVVGLALGVRRNRAAAPVAEESNVVTIIEHDRANRE